MDGFPLTIISASAHGIRGGEKIAQGKVNIHMVDFILCVTAVSLGL